MTSLFLNIGAGLEKGIMSFAGVSTVKGETTTDKILGITGAVTSDLGFIVSMFPTPITKGIGAGLITAGSGLLMAQAGLEYKQNLINKTELITQESLYGIQLLGGLTVGRESRLSFLKEKEARLLEERKAARLLQIQSVEKAEYLRSLDSGLRREEYLQTVELQKQKGQEISEIDQQAELFDIDTRAMLVKMRHEDRALYKKLHWDDYLSMIGGSNIQPERTLAGEIPPPYLELQNDDPKEYINYILQGVDDVRDNQKGIFFTEDIDLLDDIRESASMMNGRDIYKLLYAAEETDMPDDVYKTIYDNGSRLLPEDKMELFLSPENYSLRKKEISAQVKTVDIKSKCCFFGFLIRSKI